MLLIRADGNPEIGTGHIMRCLSLADAFREKGREIIFVTAEPHFRPVIQRRGYPCLVLGTSYDQMEREVPLVRSILAERQPELVILDSYFATASYMKAIKDVAPLLYIDDRNAYDYPVNAVVNYNIYGPEMPYPQDKACFLGPRYALLRKEFQGLGEHVIKEQMANILISTGGTDPYHVALRCAEYLQGRPIDGNSTFHIVVGAMNRDAMELERISGECSCIKLHKQVTDMCSLMLQCDAAVSAAGTTLYELCACGLPTVTYILADNQLQGARAFQEENLMPCVGDVRKDARFARRILDGLRELNSVKLRQETARRMQALVDGAGARRLVEAVSRGIASTGY